MEVDTLIKEIDPDYHKCKHCKRLRLRTEMKISIDTVSLICSDRGYCNHLYNERIKLNQRNRSRI